MQGQMQQQQFPGQQQQQQFQQPMAYQNQQMAYQSNQSARNKNGISNYFLNKRVVITGASSGIGQGLAFWYLNNGATVILVGKDEATLKQMAQQYPTQATVVVTNITDDYQCKVS